MIVAVSSDKSQDIETASAGYCEVHSSRHWNVCHTESKI